MPWRGREGSLSKMNSFCTKAYASVSATALVTSVHAGSYVITFDDLAPLNSTSPEHGLVVSNSSSSAQDLGAVPGLNLPANFPTVKVKVNNNNGSPDLGVIFNTDASPTRDPDLQTPFDGGNLVYPNGAGVGTPLNPTTGNILIIQEITNNNGLPATTPAVGDVLSAGPDDEGAQTSKGTGKIVFQFSEAISSFGFDFVDFEASETSFLKFFGNGKKTKKIKLSEWTAANLLQFGNNTLNRIDPITADSLGVDGLDFIEKVVIFLGGSGGVDNITFDLLQPDIIVVPTPTAWLGGALGLGLLGMRRRRQA